MLLYVTFKVRLTLSVYVLVWCFIRLDLLFQGDQGGPLECSDTLAGVLSWGEEECSPSYPYVSSRVSYFYQWIVAQG